MKIFIDSNVVISAILFPQSKPAIVFRHVQVSHTAVTSTYILKELLEVFGRKFPNQQQELENFIALAGFELHQTPEDIDPRQFPFIRDKKDLPVLVSAMLSDSDILLTGDADFSGIDVKRPLILSPSAYYELLYY